jgi:hypothetical protein
MNKMPKYMAIHTLPEPMEGDAVAPIAKKVKANCTFDAYWVGTQVQLNDEGKVLRFICEWNAKNPEAVKEVFAKVPELPYDGIYPMSKLDSEDFIQTKKSPFFFKNHSDADSIEERAGIKKGLMVKTINHLRLSQPLSQKASSV